MKTLLENLRATVGDANLQIGAAIEKRYLRDWMVAAPEAKPIAVVRPKTTAEVSAILKACNAENIPVVPQGGRTGLTGAATPVEGCVLLAMERMDGVIEIDSAAATITAWAGTPLQVIQEAASDKGFFFPLDLGARGSCRIGGNLSTNAGGNRVLRYGMTRELVLGIEVVLADGTVITSLNKMLKNNAGYDLKHLFIGSEGTLGVITQVVLRLFPQPRTTCTAFCALRDYQTVLKMLNHAKSGLGATLSAFEVMWPYYYERMTGALANLTRPLPIGHGAYVLIEAMGTDIANDQTHFENVLGAAMEAGIIENAVIAHSAKETQTLWDIRDASGEFHTVFGEHVVFDISIPIGQLGDFVEACNAKLKARWPDVDAVFFGHIGDSNFHIAGKVCEGAQPEAEIDQLIYDMVRDWHGSVSAEHGIGLLKLHFLGHSRTAEEIALMRTLKKALDPNGILNPGKVFARTSVDTKP